MFGWIWFNARCWSRLTICIIVFTLTCRVAGQEKENAILAGTISEHLKNPLRDLSSVEFRCDRTSSVVGSDGKSTTTNLEKSEISFEDDGTVFVRRQLILRPIVQLDSLSLSEHYSTVFLHNDATRELELSRIISNDAPRAGRQFDLALFENEMVARTFAEPKAAGIYLKRPVDVHGTDLIQWEGSRLFFRLDGSVLAEVALQCEWDRVEFEGRECYQGIKSDADGSVSEFVSCPQLNYAILKFEKRSDNHVEGFLVSKVTEELDDITLNVWAASNTHKFEGVLRYHGFRTLDPDSPSPRQVFLKSIRDGSEVRLIENEHLQYSWQGGKIVPRYDEKAVEQLRKSRLLKGGGYAPQK